jgi:phage N-6-adenine-methyltransferase
VSVVGYRARNHPQQVAVHGADPDVDDRAITAADFAPLHARFRFTVDAAASDENARLPRYWTTADDGLARSWAGERAWVNPPYSHPQLGRWVSKAWQETGAALIVMLVPANRTEQGWWQHLVEPYRDRGGALRSEFLPGRIRFLRNGQQVIGANERPPFGCCLLIWHHDEAAAGERPVLQGSLFDDVEAE